MSYLAGKRFRLRVSMCQCPEKGEMQYVKEVIVVAVQTREEGHEISLEMWEEQQ